jgi:tetratricopeptide (TPR) repeat protein
LPCGAQKTHNPRGVNPQKATLLIVLITSASLALADDFKTVNGKEFKNAKVSHVEADGIVIKTKSGISKLYFVELPKDVQQRFGYDAVKLAEQAAEFQKQQKNPEADLKQSLEQSQAAEQRAAQSYKSATKGTLSGQVFVSTEGAENHKLGSVQVSLFARETVDTLLAVLKKYADMKTQELSLAVDAALAAMQQDATNHLIEVLRLDPKDVWAWVVLGNLYIREKDDQETGEKFIRRALEIKPNDARALNSLAAGFQKKGEIQKAVEYFDKAIAANLEFANPYYGKALTLAEHGQPQSADETLASLFAKAKMPC